MNITRGRKQNAKKFVIYGPEGIGKTTFASHFPDALYIDTEGSTSEYDVARTDTPQSWAEFMSLVEQVYKERPCKTLVIDTIDWAEKLAIKAVCDEHRWDAITQPGYGSGYPYVLNKMGALLNLLSDIVASGIHVVVLAHATLQKFEQPDEQGAYDRWTMKLLDTPKCSNKHLLMEWCDAMFFINYKTYVVEIENKKKAQGGKRMMYTSHTPYWDAKNRFGMPEEMEFDFNVLAPLFKPQETVEPPKEPKSEPQIEQPLLTQAVAKKEYEETYRKPTDDEYEKEEYKVLPKEFVEQLQEEEIMIDFVNASMIFPLSWNSRGIQECAFASQMHDAKIGDYLYIQIHSLNEQGNYVITNKMVQIVDAELNFKELELPENVADEVDTQTDVPMFQIIMPNIINNVDIYNPMGVSVYANAIDVLKEVDTSFDALDVEIRTGRRIILLGVEGFYNDENGNLHNVVTDNDDVLRYIGDSSKNELIHDFSPDFRISALKESLQFQLNLLSEKTGMGTNQFEFTSKGVKTATEVISEDSDMYSTLKKHEKVLDSAIRGLIQAIGTLLGYDIDAQDIQIDFDDSIIEDKDAERKNDQIDLANGTLRLEEYRAKWRNETEEVAKKNLPEASGVLE